MGPGGRGFRLGREAEPVNDATERIEEARPRRFRRYPEYKDSGIEWLGKIPAHWEVKRLTWLTKCLDGKRIPLNAEERGRMQGDYPYWGANSIVDYVDRWLFDEELVLLGEDGAPFFDKSRPVAFRVRGKIWVNNHAHVLRPLSTIDAKFLAHLLNCVDYRAFIDGSTRDKLTQHEMKGIPIQCPEVKEQRAIAAFLDRETARINGLVARKERLIELLQEKRAVLITRAVTRGLDQNVPMKDSGVEWLGEIPSHWRVGKLKHACENVFVGIAEAATFAYVDQGVPMLRSTDVRANRVRTDDIRCIDIAFADRLSSKQLRTDDIVTVRTGNAGVSAVVPAAYDRGQCFTLVVSRPSRTNDSRYFCYWLNARPGQEQFTVEGVGTAQVNISVPIVENALVCIPPPEEQWAIAAFLDQETAKIDALIAKIRQAIDHLKEFRTALISAAVTGKIDVREEAS